MKRRDFLRNMAVMPLIGRSCLTGSSILAGMKSAYAASGKTLIVIFQRGGCDGLNTVVPYGEDEYYKLRPDIAIAPPGSGSDAALDLDGFFGLNPALKGLYDIYQQGDLAVLPSVHYANANRSHFSSENFIESGVPNLSLSDGWLNRYLSGVALESEIRAVSFGNLAHALQGNQPVTTVSSLSAFNDSFGNEIKALESIYRQNTNSDNKSRSLLHKHGKLALGNLSTLSNLSSTSYTAANGAVYPDTLFGQQLKDIAQLVKKGVGLEIATVSNEGWDTHANQGGAQGVHATKLADFSSGIAALYKDLGAAYMNDVVILTMSEFGRTVKQNASKGTDHGNAASWFVIGQQVNGGIYGDWPGLSQEQLYQDRYLAHTIDFTNVYAEVLSKHLSGSRVLGSVLPGSNYQPVGFLS